MWKGSPGPTFSIAYSLTTTGQILLKFGTNVIVRLGVVAVQEITRKSLFCIFNLYLNCSKTIALHNRSSVCP